MKKDLELLHPHSLYRDDRNYKIFLERVRDEPIIRPSLEIPAMGSYAFNPGVIFDKNFKMLIRGSNYENQMYSDLLYAESDDGIKWEIAPEPVLKHGEREWANFTKLGVEDPRIVKWLDYYYIFATAWSPYRIRVGIWRTKDLADPNSYEWIGIPCNQEDKNASILPKQIDGKVYLIHRPGGENMLITRTTDPELRGGWKDDEILLRSKQVYRSPFSNIEADGVGLAGPPLETEQGWLTFFHVRHKEKQLNKVYSLSFMVLDSHEPKRIKYLHPKPILWPQLSWEIYGAVPNVVFSCANVLVDDEVWVYYGAADTVIGLAKAKLESLLKPLQL